MEFYTVTVPPAEYPVTLAEAKAYMKITSTAEDDIITALIVSCTNTLELYTGRYFIVRTVEGDFSNIFISGTEIYPWVKIRRAPFNTMTSVKISVDSVFVDESYQLKQHTHGFSRVLFNNLNDTLDDIPYPLQIIFTAGYGDATAVPEEIKTAIMMFVNFLYRNRGDCVESACDVLKENSGLSPVVRALMTPYKIIEVYA